MFAKNVSGQFLYFSLTSVVSGNPVTGFSGQISGRKAIDGGSLVLLSGNVVEDGGGLYHANLYDFDINGNNIGFLFTASGVVGVSFSIVTDGRSSGNVYLASGQGVSLNSGQFTLPYSGQLSGQVVNLLSGNKVEVWSGTNVNLFSGSKVNVWSGQLSGFNVDLTSGRSYPASGVNTVSPAVSGQVYLASGQSVSLSSGQSTLTYSGQLSGQVVNLLSGNQVAVVSGTNVNTWSGQTQIASGPYVVTSLASGQVYLASGQSVSLNSGQSVLVSSGQLSGQKVDLTSGQSYTASGVNTVSPPPSGQTWLASGSVILPSGGLVGLFSGQFTSPFSGQLSGQVVNLLSGQLSGFTVDLMSGRSYPASGVYTNSTATVQSGQVYLASGQSVSLNSGQFTLPYSGQMSGQVVNLLSGNKVEVWSGSTYLASESVGKDTFSSGVLDQEIPYNILMVDCSGITGEAARSPLNALRKLINKWDAGVTSSGVLSVFKENDSTLAYTQNIGATSGAAPVTSLGS